MSPQRKTKYRLIDRASDLLGEVMAVPRCPLEMGKQVQEEDER